MLGIPCAKPGQIERAHCFLVPWCWELSVNHHSWQKWAHLKGNSGILASLFCSRQHVTHTPWDSLHSTCCNVFDQTSHSPVLVFGFLNTEPKGCKDGLDSIWNLQWSSVFVEEPICWYPTDMPASVTTETIFSGLYCFALQVLHEYALQNGNKYHNPRETVMLGHLPSPPNTHTNSTNPKHEFSLSKSLYCI